MRTKLADSTSSRQQFQRAVRAARIDGISSACWSRYCASHPSQPYFRVPSVQLHIARMQVGGYLLQELSQLSATRYAKSDPGAWISSQDFEAVSGGVVKGLQGLRRIVARIGAQRRRKHSRRLSRRAWTLPTSRASSRTLLAGGALCGS